MRGIFLRRFCGCLCFGAMPAAGVGATAYAEEDGLHIRTSRVTGRASFVTPANGMAIPTAATPGDPRSVARRFLDAHGHLFGVADPAQELVLDQVDTDPLGFKHTTYRQAYKAIPVFSGILKVHENATGDVVAANGDVYPIVLKGQTSPTLTMGGALKELWDEIGDGSAAVERGELVIVDPGWYGDPSRGARLAYHIVATSLLSPTAMGDTPVPMRETFFVDAHTGAVLDRWSMIYDARDRQVHDAHAGTNCCFPRTDAGCDDEDCEAVICERRPSCCDDQWTSVCAARAAHFCGTTCLPGTLARSEGDPPAGLADADALYDYLGDTYDYFFRAFGRDSYDDQGGPIITTANSIAVGCPNAAWISEFNQSLFCTGTVADDLVAHEYVHALTEHTANLIYQNQSGQLNESYSDIFGELVDLFNGDVSFPGPAGGAAWPTHGSGPGYDVPNAPRTTCSDGRNDYPDGVRWMIAEDSTAFGEAIRDMWDPTCLGDPDFADSSLQTCSIIDAGGVHSGSGIPNHAFALLTDGGSFNGYTIDGIGPIKAGAVWYRALTTYLIVSSDFDEAYAALVQAASDLVGTYPNDPRTGLPSGDVFTTEDAANVDRALQSVEMNSVGRCGATVAVLESAPPAICANPVTLMADDFEDTPLAWTVSNEGAFGPPNPYDWVLTEEALPLGREGVAWYAADPGIGDCVRQNESAIHVLVSPEVVLPDEGEFFYLRFTHYMETEPGWDGGRVSLRVNGEAWRSVPRTAFEYNPYNTVLQKPSVHNLNPLAGKDGWSGVGGRWGTSVVGLNRLASAGDRLEIRFDFGKDGCGGGLGWFVDDVVVYMCGDCNRNNVPDHRDFHFTAATESAGNIGSGSPQAVTVELPPRAEGDVTLTFRAQADVRALDEWLAVQLNGQRLGRVFESGAADCAFASDIDTLVLSADRFNELVGGSDAVFTISASDTVSPVQCNLRTFVTMSLAYELAHRDEDGNGIPDECEGCGVSESASAELALVAKNRYVSFVPGSAGRHTALRMMVVDMPPTHAELIGRELWIGSPQRISELPGRADDAPPTMNGASLTCEPAFADWGSLGMVHIFDEWIVPGGIFEVRSVDLACGADSASMYSASLTVTTGVWGDVAGICGDVPCGQPDGVVDVTDVGAVLDKFRDAPGALPKPQTDLAGRAPNAIVDILDVVVVTDAFRGSAYPFAGDAARCTE